MKSNRHHETELRQEQDIDTLRSLIKKEKDALLSMFLSNASISSLSSQYKIIDDLNERVSQRNRS